VGELASPTFRLAERARGVDGTASRVATDLDMSLSLLGDLQYTPRGARRRCVMSGNRPLTVEQAPTPLLLRIFRVLESERWFIAILAISLTLPLCLSRSKEVIFLGLPLITSGDEPHYLVMINSLLDDGDLDLRDDYASARQGSMKLGPGRAGAPLDRHLQYYGLDGKPYGWSALFEYPPGPASVARLRPGVPQYWADRPQYSQHPIGLAVLLAPLLYVVRGTPWVEHLAVMLAALATFGTALCVRQLFRAVSNRAGIVNAATLVTVLGSPLWHYGRTLFSEPWLALLAVAAIALALRKNAYFLAGCCIAIGVQMKPPFALLAIPLLMDRALCRDLRGLIGLAMPLVGSAGLVLIEDQHFYGSPFRSAQPWVNGNLLEGMLGVTFSWNHGIIPFAPAIVLSLWGFRDLFRSHRRQAWIVAGTFLFYYLLMSLWPFWRGGYCYGPRLTLPVIAFAFFGIVRTFESLPARSPRFQRFALVMCSLSVGISAAGALLNLAFWDSHPLIGPLLLIYRHL
jgi:hypothetical protein